MQDPIKCSAVYPTLAAPDVAASCTWYVEKLGFELRFLWGDPPTHGAITFGGACVHFWQGPAQPNQNWIYFDVSDVDAMFRRAQDANVRVQTSPKTYPWGMREFNAVDLNGYEIRFGQHVGS